MIHFDRRGTGLSDPVPLHQLPDLETQVGDAVAVLKAAGSDRAAEIGLNDGTIVAALLTVAHPELCRLAAAAIEGARFVELPGTDHLAFSEGIDGLLDDVEEFLTGARTEADPDRMLTTLLFTDIVNSTTLAAQWWRRWDRPAFRSAPASTPGRSRCAVRTSKGWPSTSRPGSQDSPAVARCWSRAR